MMRFGDYIRTTAKAFARQPGRTALTITAMAISATILMTLAAISLGLAQAAQTTLAPNNAANTVVVTPTRTAATASIFGGAQEVTQGNDKLTDDMLATLRTAPNVASAVPLAEIWEFKSFTLAGTAKNFVAQAAGAPADIATSRPLAAGSYFAPGSAEQQVVLGHGYARELGVSPQDLVGRKVTITTQNGYIGVGAEVPPPTATAADWQAYRDQPTTLTATITGVLQPGLDESRMYISLGWAHQVRTHFSNTYNNRGQIEQKQEDQIAKDGYSSILVIATAPQHVEGIVATAKSLGVGAISTLDQLKKIMQFANVLWVGLGAIAVVTLLAGSLGIINTMLTAVAEQRYAIAVWRACGASKKVIAAMFVTQAIVMGLLGGLIGAGLSLLATYAANRELASILTAQNLGVVNIATAAWWLLLSGVAVTVLFAVLAGLYPALRAARQDPSLALNAGQ